MQTKTGFTNTLFIYVFIIIYLFYFIYLCIFLIQESEKLP